MDEWGYPLRGGPIQTVVGTNYQILWKRQVGETARRRRLFASPFDEERQFTVNETVVVAVVLPGVPVAVIVTVEVPAGVPVDEPPPVVLEDPPPQPASNANITNAPLANTARAIRRRLRRSRLLAATKSASPSVASSTVNGGATRRICDPGTNVAFAVVMIVTDTGIEV